MSGDNRTHIALYQDEAQQIVKIINGTIKEGNIELVNGMDHCAEYIAFYRNDRMSSAMMQIRIGPLHIIRTDLKRAWIKTNNGGRKVLTISHGMQYRQTEIDIIMVL
jgi:hypothetical protein